MDMSKEGEVWNTSKLNSNPTASKVKSTTSYIETTSKEVRKPPMGPRSTDSVRVMKFTKELSSSTIMLDRRDVVLRRKRLKYLDSVSQFYDIPDTKRSDDEINMLCQISVDCPRTVPDVTFFQQAQVQKSLDCILYTWAIRHPASGYVQGINDLATPFLVVFLSEY